MIPLIIFLVKLFEYFIETKRVGSIARGARLSAALCAFLEVGIWAAVFKVAFLTVQFYSWEFIENIIAYALGSAVGTFIGTGTIITGEEK